MQHPIDNMMQTTMENIRGMVDVNTVVGSPVAGAKGTTIIPISKVSFGFIAGGGEYTMEDSRNRSVATDVLPFAGGTGAGVSVQPVGFLVVGDGSVKMLPAQTSGAMERVVELLPQLLEDLSQNGETKKTVKTETLTETVMQTGEEDA
ncbi:MAG: GerW family sporulation protein [Clostridia bacterium]|nr:GerW family sporulation protein [Clostridia bacterium]